MVCVNSDEGVSFTYLFLAQLTYVFNWIETRVLRQREWNFFEGICECTNGVLLDSFNLVSSLRNGDGASELSSTAATNDVVIFDHITHNTDCVMKATSSLVANNAGTTSNKDCNRFRVVTILNQNDSVV
jgi:hypothetical protein